MNVTRAQDVPQARLKTVVSRQRTRHRVRCVNAMVSEAQYEMLLAVRMVVAGSQGLIGGSEVAQAPCRGGGEMAAPGRSPRSARRFDENPCGTRRLDSWRRTMCRYVGERPPCGPGEKTWQESAESAARLRNPDESAPSDDHQSPAVCERQLCRHLPGGVGGDGGGQSRARARLWRRSLDAARVGRVPRVVREADCEVFFAFNGTAANSLALASLCQSYHSVICSSSAHVETDECGAPEFFSNGSKLLIARERGRQADARRSCAASPPAAPTSISRSRAWSRSRSRPRPARSIRWVKSARCRRPAANSACGCTWTARASPTPVRR